MISLMAHMIPFYPSREKSMEIALTMLEEGVEYLEVQFAFSDPGADGPVIEAACQKALRNGFTVDKGFAFLDELNERSPKLKNGSAQVFLMSYASIAYTRGFDEFTGLAAEAGIRGLIVPDLPIDSDEGLGVAASDKGLSLVPVLAASSRPDRVRLARESGAEYIYCALRKGITGQKTELGNENISFLEEAGKNGAKIMAGFGISTPEQIQMLDGNAHAAVVGSAFLRAHDDGFNGRSGVDAVRALVRNLKTN